MANTYTLIASTTLTGNSTEVTWSSIPQTFTDLVIKISVRSNYTAGDMRLRINGNSTSIYSYTILRGNGATATSARYSTTGNNLLNGLFGDTTFTANTFGSMELYLPNYTSTVNKTASNFGAGENNATTAYIQTEAHLLRDTNPITSITLIDTFSTGWTANSSFFLYGIKST